MVVVVVGLEIVCQVHFGTYTLGTHQYTTFRGSCAEEAQEGRRTNPWHEIFVQVPILDAPCGRQRGVRESEVFDNALEAAPHGRHRAQGRWSHPKVRGEAGHQSGDLVEHTYLLKFHV